MDGWECGPALAMALVLESTCVIMFHERGVYGWFSQLYLHTYIHT